MFESLDQHRAAQEEKESQAFSPEQRAAQKVAAVLLVASALLNLVLESFVLDVEVLSLWPMLAAVGVALLLAKHHSIAPALGLTLAALRLVLSPLLSYRPGGLPGALMAFLYQLGLSGALFLLLVGVPTPARRRAAILVFLVLHVGLFALLALRAAP